MSLFGVMSVVVALRRFFSIIFELNSLRVRTERSKGRNRVGYLDDYRLTAVIKEVKAKLSIGSLPGKQI